MVLSAALAVASAALAVASARQRRQT